MRVAERNPTCLEEAYKKYKRRFLQFHKVFRGHQTAVNRCFEWVMAVIGPPELGEIPCFGAMESSVRRRD